MTPLSIADLAATRWAASHPGWRVAKAKYATGQDRAASGSVIVLAKLDEHVFMAEIRPEAVRDETVREALDAVQMAAGFYG